MSEPLVYLDNNATTPIDPQVLEAMLPFFTTHFANAASTSHSMGLDVSDAVENAREQIAHSIGASLREVIFTSGATESNNLAIKGVLRRAGRGSHVIVNAAEHKAVLDPVARLRREGFEVTVLPVDENACVSIDSVSAAIRPNTVLVSAMFANNEVGSINPVAEIGSLCREQDVLFHCDAAQALGKVSFDLESLNVDLLSLSAHKVYGPKGVGVLYVRDREPAVPIEPLMHGGGHEDGLRSGTLPAPLIVGFGEAAALAARSGESDAQQVQSMRDALWLALTTAFDDLILNGDSKNRLAGTLNFSVPDVDGDVLLSNIEGIAVSSGSACTTAEPEPSHVLRAMGRSSDLARASLRVSFGRFNRPEDVDVAAAAITKAIEETRAS
ncbi:MAG: cysteine desulfurase family protein [Planctomycetaceae bacterium]